MPSPNQPELSERARRLLKSMERRPAVPTEQVEASIVAAGCTPYAPWLDFHERYAGYVEQFYQDWFVWGLAHRETYWWTPNEVELDRDGSDVSIYCAEGHPTYSYKLDANGEFAGHAGHRSFDLYVERVAAVRELVSSKTSRDLSREELHGTDFRKLFEETTKPFLAADLSDQYWSWYITATHLVIQDAETGNFCRAWELPKA